MKNRILAFFAMFFVIFSGIGGSSVLAIRKSRTMDEVVQMLRDMLDDYRLVRTGGIDHVILADRFVPGIAVYINDFDENMSAFNTDFYELFKEVAMDYYVTDWIVGYQPGKLNMKFCLYTPSGLVEDYQRCFLFFNRYFEYMRQDPEVPEDFFLTQFVLGSILRCLLR